MAAVAGGACKQTAGAETCEALVRAGANPFLEDSQGLLTYIQLKKPTVATNTFIFG